MRKYLLLLITVSFLVMVNAQLVTAQILWGIVQNRIYEDGRDFTRVVFEVLNDERADQIESVTLLDPSGDPVPGVELATATRACDLSTFSAYRDTGYYWDWTSVTDESPWRYRVYFSWDLHDYPLELEVGDYEIQAVFSDTGLSTYTFQFTGYKDLPVVSLVSKKEKIKKAKSGGKLDLEELSDGSLVLRWNGPAVPDPDTSARAFIILQDRGPEQCDVSVAMKQPTQMGMLIISPDAVNALQCNEYYQGYFEFQVQLRFDDNSVRTYSNKHKYYFKNSPDCTE